MRDRFLDGIAVVMVAPYLIFLLLTELFPSREAEYLDLLRRVESVQWRQGSEVGRECPICKKDTPGHLEGCELAEALEMER